MISELVVYHVRIPLKRTIRHASQTRDETETLLVRCRLASGETGWGEGLPRAYVTGESIEDAWQLAQGQQWSQALPRQWSTLTDLVDQLGRFELTGLPSGARPCFGHSLRCAVELAILDAAFQAAGRPLYEVTALVPETLPIRQISARVQYSAAVTAMSGWRELIRLLKLRVYDFAHVKVKVGVAGHNDVACLARFRQILGDAVDLRIDANEAWSLAELPGKVAELAPFRLSVIEQPVPHADVAGLAALREQLGVPIMLDESAACLADVYRAVELGLADLFNLRLSKCGGFLPTLKMAAAVHRAGLGYQLGCQVGETGILSAAGRHFACSVGGLKYVEGSYDRHLVREPLIREDLTFRYGGWASALTAPGLGVTVDETAVRRVTQATQAWSF